MNTIRKLKVEENYACHNPQHKIPKDLKLEAGLYLHTCPACEKNTVFQVRQDVCSFERNT